MLVDCFLFLLISMICRGIFRHQICQFVLSHNFSPICIRKIDLYSKELVYALCYATPLIDVTHKAHATL